MKEKHEQVSEELANADLMFFSSALTRAFGFLQDVPLFCFLEVFKINHRGRRQKRFLIVTSTHVYSCLEDGSIKRCVETCKVAEVHTWSGGTPQIALKIPSEYDLFFFVDAVADVAALVTALLAATKEVPGGGLRVVKATEALTAADFSLERPKGFQRAVTDTFTWCIGSAGEVGDVGSIPSEFQPFVLAGTKGIFLSGTAANCDYRSYYDNDTDGDNNNGNDGNSSSRASRLLCALDKKTEMSEETTESLCDGSKHLGDSLTGTVVPEQKDAVNSGSVLTQGAACEVLRQYANERERWCMLLAAERHSAYRLRQAIAGLREKVLSLTLQNMALRTELLDRRVAERSKGGSYSFNNVGFSE